MAIEIGQRVKLIDGIEGFPPTSGGGFYQVSAIDADGRFCVDGMETWLEAGSVAEVAE